MNNMDAEKAVLSVLISKPNSYFEVLDLFDPSHFSLEFHKFIAESIQKIHAEGTKLDVVTLLNEVNKIKDIAKYIATGETVPSALMSIASDFTTSGNLQKHLLILRQNAIRTKQMLLGHELLEKAKDASKDVLDNNEWLIQKAGELTELENISEFESNKEVVNRLIKKHEQLASGEIEQGIYTGLEDFDRVYSFRGSEFTVIAARPAMGKTAFAMQIAEDAARNQGKKVAVFSMEMSKDQLLTRLIAMRSGESAEQLNKGKINNISAYQRACSEMYTDDLIIYDMKNKISHIRNLRLEAKKLKAKEGLDMVVIDYIQLMEGSGKSREQIIADISRNCKLISTELDIPVIGLSQLSRQVEQRPDKRPQLSDLRESGAIEQDADGVIFLYRPEYYGITEDANGISQHGMAYALIGKNRNGRTGDIPLRFMGRSTVFYGVNEPTPF